MASGKLREQTGCFDADWRKDCPGHGVLKGQAEGCIRLPFLKENRRGQGTAGERFV